MSGKGGFARVPKVRKQGALGLREREDISRGLAEGRSLRHLASALKLSPSTISREVIRNVGRPVYRAIKAEEVSAEQIRRSKLSRLDSHHVCANWLQPNYPTNGSLRKS